MLYSDFSCLKSDDIRFYSVSEFIFFVPAFFRPLLDLQRLGDYQRISDLKSSFVHSVFLQEFRATKIPLLNGKQLGMAWLCCC
ncbi:unnamed protein product [Cuscuta epithymum]|uniref:Uncharacterized protein n=1 Tax=Cuscuta epithymum TaxID=186058 RepID=A0AAV0F210_9ASTE|nr:unnamed protein product [Cuscuta epithymum]